MQKSDLSAEVQKQIIADFKSDKNAFSEVYDFYYERILKYLAKRTMSSEVAYDLTAETFMKAFETFHKFKWKGISIKVWLYRIAINALKNHWRDKKKRSSPLTEEIVGVHEDLRTDAKAELVAMDKAMFGDEKVSKLSDAIAALNPKYQNVISLYYFSGMSQKEIASVLNKSLGSVKVMMHRATKNLKQLLTPNLA